jgi:hypothetical protein
MWPAIWKPYRPSWVSSVTARSASALSNSSGRVGPCQNPIAAKLSRCRQASSVAHAV